MIAGASNDEVAEMTPEALVRYCRKRIPALQRRHEDLRRRYLALRDELRSYESELDMLFNALELADRGDVMEQFRIPDDPTVMLAMLGRDVDEP